MKKLNFTHFTPIILLTLLVTGCLPDSLTKWKKDPPQKPVAASTLVPVVDSTGKKLTFTAPTYFTYTQGANTTFNLQINVEANATSASYDGSLRDKTNGPKFIISCGLDLTGDAQTQSLPPGLAIDALTCNISGTPTATLSVASGKEFCSDPLITTQEDCVVTPFTWDATSETCSNKDFKYQNQKDCEAGLNTWYSKGDAIPYRVKFSYKDADGYPHEIYATVPIGVYSRLAAVRYTFADKLLLGVTPADKDTFNSAVPVKTSGSSTPYIPANMISSLNGVQGVINYINPTNSNIGVHPLVKMTLNKSIGANGYQYFKAGNFVKADATSVSGKEVVGRIYKTDTSNPNVIYIENISDNEAYFSKGDTIKYYLYSGGWSLQPDSATITSIDDTYYFSKTTTPDLDNDEQYYGSKYTLKNPPINSYTVGKSVKPLKAILDVTPDPSIVFSISPKLPDGLSLDASTGTISGTFSKSTAATTFTVTATNPLGAVTNAVRLISSDAPSDLSISNRQVITVSNTVNFTEGETIRQPIVAPALTSTSAKILKILNSYQMAVEVQNGKFSQKASLDSGATYLAEKAFIIPDNSCVDSAYTTKTTCEAASKVWSSGDIFYSVSAKAKYTGTGTAPTFVNGECRKIDSNGVDGGASSDNNKLDCESNSKEGSLQIWTPTRIINSATATSSSSYGIITHAIKEDANNYILFISHNTAAVTGLTNAKKFSVGETIYKLSPSTGAYGTTDFQFKTIDSNSVVLSVSSLTGFSAGGEVTLADATYTSGKAGGYIYNVDNSGTNKDIYLSDVSYAPQRCSDTTKTTKSACTAAAGTWYEPVFSSNVAGDVLYNSDTVGGATSPSVTISNVSHDILIIGERGKDLYFNATNSSSGVSTYTVSPDLPSGLKLNSSTGEITGAPIVAMPRREFTIKATNFVDQASFVFAMEVRDYFEITDASGAQSFIMHKTGSTRFNRPCRVNSNDIANASGEIDIRCYLDGEEEDVYFNSLKLKATVGPGICEYVEYAPYYFWYFPPYKTTGQSFTVVEGCTPPGGNPPGSSTKKPTRSQVCTGDHTADKGPNCDEGGYSVTTISYGTNPASGVCEQQSSVNEQVSCEGQKTNCIAGPLTDLLSETKIQDGQRSQIYQTSTEPYSKTWSVTNYPDAKSDLSTMRVANAGAANRCSFSNANNVDTWVNATSAIEPIVSPWGESQPYYTFHCLDSAQEIKARIRIVVREWDKAFKVNSDIDSDHNVALNVNAPTQYPVYYSNKATDTLTTMTKDSHLTDKFFRPYNNFNDWDDDYAGGGVCSLTSYFDEYTCLLNKGSWTPSACVATSISSSTSCTAAGALAALPDSGIFHVSGATWQTDGANFKRCYVTLQKSGVTINPKTDPWNFSQACSAVGGRHAGIASFKFSNNSGNATKELSCSSTCTDNTYTDASSCVSAGQTWVPHYCWDFSTGSKTTDTQATCTGGTKRWLSVMPGCSDGKSTTRGECGICSDSSKTNRTDCLAVPATWATDGAVDATTGTISPTWTQGAGYEYPGAGL